MAQPIPIFTSPSTTLVQVDSNTIESPYTPVILNAVAYPGQLVTVLNTLSSLAILNEPIVVSTITGTYFSNSNISTLIQQPQGFLTAQTVLPNTWTYLNSYPFRDQYVSAGLQNLTTSTLVTAVISTINDITSSLRVENLVVSGNFFQSSGLILNTSVSSLGSVYILSSLTVLGPTEFSSSVSSLSYSVFGSTFQVYGDFFSRSTIQFASSLNVSTSVSAVGDGFVSGPNRPIQLQGGLIGTSLEVQASTSKAMDVAGYFLVNQTLSTLSSMNIGKELFLRDITVTNNLSSLKAVSVYDSVVVGNGLLAKRDLSVGGTLGIQQDLRIGESLTVTKDINVYKNLLISKDLLSLSTLSTQTFAAESAFIQGNLTVSSAVVSTQNLFINGSLGFQSMISLSTTVGGHTSTVSNLVLLKDVFIDGYFLTVGNISTISSFSVLQDVYTLANFSTGTSLWLSGGMTVGGNLGILRVLNANVKQADPLISTVFENDLSIINGISITDTAVISSIVLPSSVLAFSFVTSTMTAGYQGIASNVLISTLKTSSIATGGLLNAEKTMDMQNLFQTRNLSTFQLSSLLFQVGLSSQPSTSIQFTSSLGVLTNASPNTLDINTTLYTLSNTYINKTLSSAQLFTPFVQGTFKGDGSFLSNINYPAKVSSLSLSTGSLVVEKTFLSSLIVSSGLVVDAFLSYSTLKIGDFNIYGNARQDILQSSNTLRTKQGSAIFLALNNMYMYGDTNNITQKQVIVSSNANPTLSPSYTLGVDGTLRLNSLLSPNFSLFIQSFSGDVIVGVNVGSLNTNTMYVSSGSIGYNNTPFFVPSGQSYINLSTNIIQPSFSTLAFNSTLFVYQQNGTVGINTVPFYNLDVKGEAYAQQGLLVSQSTSIQGLNMNQQRSSFWLGVTSNDTASNILYSADEGESWSYFTPTNAFQGGTLLNVATNGGQLNISRSNTLQSEKLWVATGVPTARYYREGSDSWSNISHSSKLPQSNAGIAYNGRLWVLTGYNSSNLSPATAPPLHWSEDGIYWYKANTGGFTWDSVSQSYGGQSVAWNGSLWVTVGLGASVANSILYSGDGKNWSDAKSGGFTNGGYGVVWSGSNWIATGDNGGPLSSFCVSDDGSNWTAIGGYGFNGTLAQRGNAVATNGSLVVAVGSYNAGSPTIASIQYSEDRGYTWINASGTLFNVDGYEGLSVVYNGNYWLAGGTNGIRKSYDGKNWYQPSGSLTSGMFHGLSFSSNAQPLLQIGASNYVSSFTSTITTFNVACGVDNTTMDSNCLRYSGDGINWSNAVSGYFREQGRAAAYNGSNLWVSAGKGTASNFIYSGNGKNWSDGIFHTVLGLFAIGTSVVYGGGYWVGTMDTNGGGGDTLFHSADGSNWYAVDSVLGVEFTTAGLGVAYGNGNYTAVGSGTYTILYAQNTSPPNQWKATGITNAFDTQGNAVAYGNSRWIACGQDTGGKTIKYSGNQATWTDATGVFPAAGAGYGVDYNGSNMWVAVGNGSGTTSNILYSTDNGASWSGITSGDFLTYGSGVRYNQALGLWLAAGFDNPGQTLKYSGDGLNWSNATNSFDFTGYGIGVASNVFSTQTTYINQLRLYNTPGFGVTTRDTTPNISYTSTSITYMNTMTLDRFKTVSIQKTSPNYVSSLYDSSLAVISSFVSTNVTQVAGYFLTSALV